MSRIKIFNGSTSTYQGCTVKRYDSVSGSWKPVVVKTALGGSWHTFEQFVKVINTPATNCVGIGTAEGNLFVTSLGTGCVYNIDVNGTVNIQLCNLISPTSVCRVASTTSRIFLVQKGNELHYYFGDTFEYSSQSYFGILPSNNARGADVSGSTFTYVDSADKKVYGLYDASSNLDIQYSFSVSSIGYPTGLTLANGYTYVLSGAPDVGDPPSDLNTIYKLNSSTGAIISSEKIEGVTSLSDFVFDSSTGFFWLLDRGANKIYLYNLTI